MCCRVGGLVLLWLFWCTGGFVCCFVVLVVLSLCGFVVVSFYCVVVLSACLYGCARACVCSVVCLFFFSCLGLRV